EGTVTGSASVRQADGRILRVGPVKDDGAADDLDHLGVRDAGGDRFAGLAGALGSGFEDLELQELASVEGVLHGLDGLGGCAFLADLEDRLEGVRQSLEVRALPGREHSPALRSAQRSERTNSQIMNIGRITTRAVMGQTPGRAGGAVGWRRGMALPGTEGAGRGSRRCMEVVR